MTLELVARKYAVAVSPTLMALIDPADPHDPIARQFLPDLAELIETEAERADPIGDAAHSPVTGIVHRHADRVLFKAVSKLLGLLPLLFPARNSIGPAKHQGLVAGGFRRRLRLYRGP